MSSEDGITVRQCLQITSATKSALSGQYNCARDGLSAFDRWCSKTILWARTRNIDSKSEPRTQFRFKQLAVRIRLLRSSGSLRTLSTLSTHFGQGPRASFLGATPFAYFQVSKKRGPSN